MIEQNEKESIEQPKKRTFKRKYFTEEQKRKKLCSLCGEKVNKREDKTWNLDYSKDIVCDSCLSRSVEHPRKEEIDFTDIDAVKKLYEATKARKIPSAVAIACLERITQNEFKSTRDFRQKMEAFLKKHYYKGIDLRRARKWSGMEQSELAEWFNVSKHRIIQMETGKKPLSQDAIDFIKVMGFAKRIPLKKCKKSVKVGYPTCNPKNGSIPPEKKTSKSTLSAQIKQFTKEEAFPHIYGDLK